PYGAQLYSRALEYIGNHEMLSASGELVAEYNPKLWSPKDYGNLTQLRTKVYGSTALIFFGWKDI
ncbi:MAG: 16S rRNA (guanine(966)-N(2))-methyltransferase RsmD, partial [Cyanobacteria bacterium P01_D01_bin.73]